MATYYVYSGATGTGDGSSYTNAVTTFAAGVAKLAAGDSLYVLNTHAETTGATTTYALPGTPAAPNLVVCTDSSSNPTTGAVITTNTCTLTGAAYFYGFGFVATATGAPAISLASLINNWMRFSACYFSLTNTGSASIYFGASALGKLDLINTYVKFAAAAHFIKVQTNTLWRNTVSAVQGVAPSTLFSASTACLLRCEALDLSFVTGTLVGTSSTTLGIYDLKDCKIAAGVTIAASPAIIGQAVQTSRTDSAGTNYKTNYITYRGTQSTETTVVRTGGASDGTTAVSWKLATNAGVSWPSNFETPPVVIWNSLTGSTRNVTLHGIVNAAAQPNNDQLWIDVEYLSDASSGMGASASGTKANVLTTGTALAADTTSAWDSAATARANSTAYTAGQIYKAASNPGRIFFCTTAGTTAASEPAGYASAVDGGSVTDGTAVFRAGFRFQQTVSVTAAQPGYIYAYPKVGAASATYWLDPLLVLS